VYDGYRYNPLQLLRGFVAKEASTALLFMEMKLWHGYGGQVPTRPVVKASKDLGASNGAR